MRPAPPGTSWLLLGRARRPRGLVLSRLSFCAGDRLALRLEVLLRELAPEQSFEFASHLAAPLERVELVRVQVQARLAHAELRQQDVPHPLAPIGRREQLPPERQAPAAAFLLHAPRVRELPLVGGVGLQRLVHFFSSRRARRRSISSRIASSSISSASWRSVGVGRPRRASPAAVSSAIACCSSRSTSIGIERNSCMSAAGFVG